MKIKIKLFGNCKDIFRAPVLQINFAKGVKVKNIRNKLIEIVEKKYSSNKAYKDLIKKSAFLSIPRVEIITNLKNKSRLFLKSGYTVFTNESL